MITKKALEIPPFIVMDILEKAQEMQNKGKDIIHLEIGEPDFNTPECIKEASIRAIQNGQTHYTHSLGLIELREAICDHYYKKYAVDLSPDRIIVTSGTSPAMLIIFSSILNKGDEVIISNPHYACYPNFINFFDGNAVHVNVYEEDGFRFSPEAVKQKISRRTKAILINSPCNPTGTLLDMDRMSSISAFGVPIISDEIYHGLVYEGEEHSILECTDNAFVINGFSKNFAMTGWRLGYLIAPKAYIRPLQNIHQNLFISANAFVQWGGVAALREAGPDVMRMRDIYNQRRKFMIKRLREIGLRISFEPTGAFYILANVQEFSQDSYKMAYDILESAHVAVCPGIDFGNNAEGYLRFSYANSMENIAEGLNRLEKYLKNIQRM